MSRIEQLIGEIEEFINNCKPSTFSPNKLIVNKDDIMELLMELRAEVPAEIKQYQKIISNQDAIIADAKNQANSMMAEASKMTKQLVDEHEIMQKAHESANKLMEEARNYAQRLVDDAYDESDNLKSQTIRYIDDLLASVSSNIQYSMQDAQSRFDQLSNSLNITVNTIEQNRVELSKSYSDTQAEEPEQQEQGEIQLQ
jgi:hypothetical protein